MKPLTTSTYTFSELVRGGYLYVDKTDQIYRLIDEYKGQYFLSRPRRFGKSLLVSTLKSIFRGQQSLFEGLEITRTDYRWPVSPVIHLDLGSVRARSVDELEKGLLRKVCQCASENECQVDADNCYDAFEDLIIELSSRDGNVVILVDEYDKPLLNHIGADVATDIQSVFKSFYSVIKTTEAHQRFVLLTGVSKFSKVSVFSDLNNLTDLTMQRGTATLLGYTQDELENNFPGYLERLADAQSMERGQVLKKVREWYNGYRFHPAGETVYNPVSVMKCLKQGEFQNYWFETGTPTFLMNLLKDEPVETEDLSLPESALSTYEPSESHPLPLLVQTGYLTIDGTRDVMGMQYYDLDFPNREIQQSFNYWLARAMTELPDVELSRTLRLISESLDDGNVEDLLGHMRVFFSSVPHTITLDYEKYYQSIFFTVLKLIGVAVDVEVSTSQGRVDAIIKTDSDILIVEFKLHGTAEAALEQIKDKEYALPYTDDPRPITLVGAAFSVETRNIEDWKIER